MDSQLLKYIKEEIGEEWATVRGLGVVLSFLVVAFIVLPRFSSEVRNVIQVYESGYVFVLLSMVLMVSFFLTRSPYIKNFFSKKLNVIFHFNLKGIDEKKFSSEFLKLRLQIENELASHGLKHLVKITFIPTDVKLKDAEEYEKKTYSSLKTSTLIVWGFPEKKKGKLSFRTFFSFNFKYLDCGELDGEEVAKDNIGKVITSVLNSSGFLKQIGLSNFSEKMLPTIFFIESITLVTSGNFRGAIKLLRAFVHNYELGDSEKRYHLFEANQQVKKILLSVYKELNTVNYWKIMFGKGDGSLVLKESLELTKDALAINPNDYQALLYMSWIKYELGDVDSALVYTEKAEEFAMHGFYEHAFNKAFFLLRKSKIDEARMIYDGIPIDCGVNCLGIIGFLDREYKKTGNDSYNFAASYVGGKWM